MIFFLCYGKIFLSFEIIFLFDRFLDPLLQTARALLPGLFARFGQNNDDPRLFVLARRRDHPVMQRDDLLGDRKPQPRAAGRG